MALLLNAGDTVSRSYSYTQPSPLHPSLPQGTGERTGNLFDGVIEAGGLDANTGAETEQTGRRRSEYIEIEGNTNYNLSRTITATTSNLWVLFYDVNKGYISGSNKGTGDANFTVLSPANAKYLRWYVTANGSYDNLMIIEGSTAPTSYIPYGYKIPISSANTTTNNYLGEVETTRKIRKLVLTGDEAFSEPGTYPGGYLYMFIPSDIPGDNGANAVSTHYKQAYNNNGQNVYIQNRRIVIIDATHSTRDDFKSYLAAQYAAGTPVTVWYVLATPQTAVVNEPLMKIGNYADEVSGITIPVTAGGDTISVGTTVQPSEVTVNYKGWHPVADVHEYDSNYTIATMQALTIAQLQSHTIGDLEGGEWS